MGGAQVGDGLSRDQLGDVGMLEFGLVDEAAPPECLDRGFRGRGLVDGGGVGEGHVVALLGHDQGDALADAAAAAGD